MRGEDLLVDPAQSRSLAARDSNARVAEVYDTAGSIRGSSSGHELDHQTERGVLGAHLNLAAQLRQRVGEFPIPLILSLFRRCSILARLARNVERAPSIFTILKIVT